MRTGKKLEEASFRKSPVKEKNEAKAKSWQHGKLKNQKGSAMPNTRKKRNRNAENKRNVSTQEPTGKYVEPNK